MIVRASPPVLCVRNLSQCMYQFLLLYQVIYSGNMSFVANITSCEHVNFADIFGWCMLQIVQGIMYIECELLFVSMA